MSGREEGRRAEDRARFKSILCFLERKAVVRWTHFNASMRQQPFVLFKRSNCVLARACTCGCMASRLYRRLTRLIGVSTYVNAVKKMPFLIASYQSMPKQ